MHLRDEARLPETIREKAVLSGREYGWGKDDIFEAIAAARRVGLASLGGQVQLVFSDGTCELFWLNYDPIDRQLGEGWGEYVERSNDETTVALQRILETTDILGEARRSFEFVRVKESQGLDLVNHIVFICYFKSEGLSDAA